MAALPSARELHERLPRPPAAAAIAQAARKAVEAILRREDDRLLLIMGPCSVHSLEGARAYARALKPAADAVSDRILVLARCYVEKSRTSGGWLGMARDPRLDGSAGAEEGVAQARLAMLAMLDEGMPLGTELVSPFLWRYWEDLISWASVGARGVESQGLREAAKAIQVPCGFKNGRDGRADSALNAIAAANGPGRALSVSDDGLASETQASGNPYPHLILRGGDRGPNWRKAPYAAAPMGLLGLKAACIVDASHGNSRSKAGRQPAVARLACELSNRVPSLRGIMVESYLEPGCQALKPGTVPSPGISVTDPCLGLEDSLRLIEQLASIKKGRPRWERP